MNNKTVSILFVLIFTLHAGLNQIWANESPAPLLREGEAHYETLDPALLPPNTPPQLFEAEISGNTFDVFARNIAPQVLTIEMGFVDTKSKAAEQNTFSISANGSPLDANLDVWSHAGGSFKPWVMKTPFNHSGGALAIQFAGLSHSAFVSYVRISDASGKELAFGKASTWKKGERLTLLDSRSYPYRPLKVGEIPFFDVDHSPVGSWSTLIYGMSASGGVQVCKQPGDVTTLIPAEGLIIAVKNGKNERVMPFIAGQKSLPASELITDKEVTRTLGACTDNWTMPLGVSWTHYTPVWPMKEWNTATNDERRRFVLPVTWMQYHIDNRSGKDETQLLFSLEQADRQAEGWKGFEGYIVANTTSLAVESGQADLVSAEKVKQDFGLDGATSAFCVHVPAGTEKTVTFYVAQYLDGQESMLEGQPLKLMCDVLYSDINDILSSARKALPAVIQECQQIDEKLANCGEDEERRFLAADTVHSYQYNTILHATEKQEPVWVVIEGECSCINTFDLTVDHVFYELAMHPWTVRNALDNFLNIFSYTDELTLPDGTQRFPGGLGFFHDMGSRLGFTTREKGARYRTLMTQEELQNWIFCACLYWKTTGDNAWLEKNKEAFKAVLKSMQMRDDLNPAKRDGITTYISNWKQHSGEITTYDAMDASLHYPNNSLYTSVRSFGCYVALKPVFEQLGEKELAKQAADAERYTAKGILSHWDSTAHYFPATFDGKASSSIIPAIEGLAYPYMMGLKQEVSLDGPNADLIQHLKTHIQTILVPGVCIDASTGAWNLSSSSSTTWVSKVYLNQFITENILGIKNETTGKKADAAHYAYEVTGAPAVGWTDQFYTNSHLAFGCRHYPRGVTSALWWLWPHGSPSDLPTSRAK